MLFRKKYVFETKKTKFIRTLLNCIFGLLIIFSLWNALCAILLLSSTNETKEAQAVFYNKPPDLIVVFTGDTGRIPFALQTAIAYKQPNIFITGVHQKNTVDSILNKFEKASLLDTDLVDIDYEARNTMENVIYTLKYLRENPGFEKILIISSDYHIMRSKTLMNSLKTPNDNFEFYYVGIKSDYTRFHTYKVLYTEFFKLAKAFILTIFWENEFLKNE